MARKKAIALVIEELDSRATRGPRVELTQDRSVIQAGRRAVWLREIRREVSRQAIVKAQLRSGSQERNDLLTKGALQRLELGILQQKAGLSEHVADNQTRRRVRA